MQNKLIVSFIIGAILIGGGAFYGGMHYAQSQTTNGAGQGAGRGGRGVNASGTFGFGAGQGGRNGGGAGTGGGFTTGEVVSKDATSLTVKLRDGGSKVVFYSSSTRVGKMTDGSIEDLTQGTNIMVSGTTNQDGSVTASMIQIRPQGQFPPQGQASSAR